MNLNFVICHLILSDDNDLVVSVKINVLLFIIFYININSFDLLINFTHNSPLLYYSFDIYSCYFEKIFF